MSGRDFPQLVELFLQGNCIPLTAAAMTWQNILQYLPAAF